MRQKPEQLELALDGRGEAPSGQRSGEAPTTPGGDERSGGDHRLMEQVVARANALAALKRVKQNKGSPGVDGMTGGRPDAVSGQALGGDPRAVARGDLPAAPAALAEMKARVRQITSRNGGRSIASVTEELRSYLTGWKLYFRLAETPRVFSGLDKWLRHRLRAVQLKQWKRGPTICGELMARGASGAVARAVAAHATRWWAIAAHGGTQTALPTSYFDRLGVPRLGGR